VVPRITATVGVTLDWARNPTGSTRTFLASTTSTS
jgi:hypothetical protein